MGFKLVNCINDTQLMVDRQRRKKLALHLRHLSTGLISNDEFEERIMDEVTYGWLPEQYHRAKQAISDDAVMVPLIELGWFLYDDTKNHNLKGDEKLEEQSLKTIARCILFLHTEIEYQWPYFDYKGVIYNFTIKDLLQTIITLGKHYQHKKTAKEQALAAYQKLGAYEVWPFFTRYNYESALGIQPFLKQNISTNHL